MKTTHWELLRLSEVLVQFVWHFLAGKPSPKAMPIVEIILKLNAKVLQKTLKNHANYAQNEIKITLSYMELQALKKVFHLLNFDDTDFDSLNIKSKLHQLIISI